jgi:deoxyribodipyrimidine photo-lyase
MSDLILFWHRRDLRISDNVGLAKARQKSPKVVSVFCLDPGILKSEDVAPARGAYLIGCLKALQDSYRQIGSELLFLHDEPHKGLPRLAEALSAKAVFWNRDVEPYAKRRDKQVSEVLAAKEIAVETFWDQLLHAPGEVMTKSADSPYTVYTPFWKNWSQQSKAKPAPRLEKVEKLTESEQKNAEKAGIVALPIAQELGFVWDNGFVLDPGEDAARDRLAEFCDTAIYEYESQRNFPAVDGTSRLSAALKFGTIGIREVWEATQHAFANTRSDEARGSIIAWQKELAWREFYQQAMSFFPDLAKGPYREQFQDFPWDNNEDYFQAWCEGKTGYPIVDAAMRQLNETGWMHNRCRMIVASFLTKDLIIDWQWGEKYFMQRLYDGDLSANNGGWQWSASSGMDPKPLRIFNPASQAQKFDPDGEYIRQWLPELRSLEAEYLVTGNISPLDRESCDYPQPIVDHKQRQKQFKQLYQAVKR